MRQSEKSRKRLGMPAPAPKAKKATLKPREEIDGAGKSEQTREAYAGTPKQAFAALKPVVYKGPGEFPQLPWQTHFAGTALVIDMWYNIGTTAAALLALGVHFYAIGLNGDPEAAELTQRNFQGLADEGKIEDFNAEDLEEIIKKRDFTCIIIGGRPEKIWSLQARKGLPEPRHIAGKSTMRIFEEVKALRATQLKKIPVLLWLEGNGAARLHLKDGTNELMGTERLCFDAAGLGYVKRDRCFWGLSNHCNLDDIRYKLPPGFEWRQQKNETRIVYDSPKPLPKTIVIEDGYQLNFDPKETVKDPQRAMDPFVREYFRTWEESFTDASPGAQARRKQDDSRFPPRSYEMQNMVGKGDHLRVPNHRERLAMHALPPNILDELPQGNKSREQLEACKNSLASSGGHLASTMLFMFILLQLAQPTEGKLARAAARFHFAPGESDLSRRTHNTVFQMKGMPHFPGLMSQEALLCDMQEQFKPLQFPKDLKEKFLKTKLDISVSRMQCYWVWTQMRRQERGNQGPDWTGQKRRGLMAASLGSQRYPGASKRGLDHIIKPGLGKEEHARQALRLESPFIMQGVCDQDVAFTASAIAMLGPWLSGWRATQAKAMDRITNALRPLEDWMIGQMPEQVRRISEHSKPVWMAAMTSLLRWPDRRQAQGYVNGMRIIGEIEPMGVFRSLPAAKQGDPQAFEELFGDNAIKAVGDIMRSPPPKDHKDIMEATIDEQKKGWLSPFMSKDALDKKFGVGSWRCIPRFLIRQRLRDRVIDNARRGGQNRAAIFKETIYTASVDFFGEVLAEWIAQIIWELAGLKKSAEREVVLKALPSWFRPVFGLDDLPDAYRGVPLHCDDSNVTIVAVWNAATRAWIFAQSFSMLFGLSAAVLHFNRKPTLLVAASRRLFAVAATAFFDDIITMALACGENTEKKAIFKLLASVGCPRAPDKTAPTASSRTWIGVVACLADVTIEGYYELKPTTASTQAVVRGCVEAVNRGRLDKDDASSLRGKASWSNSHSAGRCGRIGMEVLKQKQYYGPPELSQDESRSLIFLARISQSIPARRIQVAGSRGPPVIVYSDASCEPDAPAPTLGWVVFVPEKKPQGRSTRMSPEVFNTLKVRRQQIFPGEVFATYAALVTHLEVLKNRDVIFFVDNEAATSALIRGSTKEQDVMSIVQAMHWTLVGNNIRAWFEWVDTEANPSDGLSRDGVSDKWTAEQGWQLEEAACPEWNSITFHEGLALETLGLPGQLQDGGDST